MIMHREALEAFNRETHSDALRDFAVFALGWLGNAHPADAATCLARYQHLKAEGTI